MTKPVSGNYFGSLDNWINKRNLDQNVFYVVTHPGKLQFYHVLLVGYGPACPKLSEITNHQYLWKGLSEKLNRSSFEVVC